MWGQQQPQELVQQLLRQLHCLLHQLLQLDLPWNVKTGWLKASPKQLPVQMLFLCLEPSLMTRRYVAGSHPFSSNCFDATPFYAC